MESNQVSFKTGLLMLGVGGRNCPGVRGADDGVINGLRQVTQGHPRGEGPDDQGLKVIGEMRGASQLVAEGLC